MSRTEHLKAYADLMKAAYIYDSNTRIDAIREWLERHIIEYGQEFSYDPVFKSRLGSGFSEYFKKDKEKAATQMAMEFLSTGILQTSKVQPFTPHYETHQLTMRVFKP